MYFITGVSGVGKTSVMPHLKKILDDSYEIHDFDERGVPDNADHKWRIEETKHWIRFAQEKEAAGKEVIVCGFSNPEEITDLKKDWAGVDIRAILLDADDSVIEERLRKRNLDPEVEKDFIRAVGDPEQFIKNNTNFASILRKSCEEYSCPRIDTTNLSPEEAATEILKIIESS